MVYEHKVPQGVSQIHQDALSTAFLSWQDKKCRTPPSSPGPSLHGAKPAPRSRVLQSCAAGSSEPGSMPAPSQGTPHTREPHSGLLPGKCSRTGQHALPALRVLLPLTPVRSMMPYQSQICATSQTHVVWTSAPYHPPCHPGNALLLPPPLAKIDTNQGYVSET